LFEKNAKKNAQQRFNRMQPKKCQNNVYQLAAQKKAESGFEI